MTPLKQITDRYKSLTTAAGELGVHVTQLRRLLDNGAVYDELSGLVYIPSKTRLKGA